MYAHMHSKPLLAFRSKPLHSREVCSLKISKYQIADQYYEVALFNTTWVDIEENSTLYLVTL